MMTGLNALSSHKPLLPATEMAVWLPMICGETVGYGNERGKHNIEMLVACGLNYNIERLKACWTWEWHDKELIKKPCNTLVMLNDRIRAFLK
eukprot:1160684-Pelagomonas_calceolata.AAC.2